MLRQRFVLRSVFPRRIQPFLNRCWERPRRQEGHQQLGARRMHKMIRFTKPKISVAVLNEPSDTECAFPFAARPAALLGCQRCANTPFRKAFSRRAIKRASPASVYLWTKSLCVSSCYFQRD